MLETRDLDGIYRRMRDAGTPILREPATTEVTGADGTRWTATFLFAFDPDGHLLEINERRN
ncbi:MAG: VOC family protein, partial [Pseudomonadota bacterium]